MCSGVCSCTPDVNRQPVNARSPRRWATIARMLPFASCASAAALVAVLAALWWRERRGHAACEIAGRSMRRLALLAECLLTQPRAELPGQAHVDSDGGRGRGRSTSAACFGCIHSPRPYRVGVGASRTNMLKLFFLTSGAVALQSIHRTRRRDERRAKMATTRMLESQIAWHAAWACVGINATSVAEAWAATYAATRDNTAAAWCRAASLWSVASDDERISPDLSYQCSLAAAAAQSAARAGR